MIRSVKPDDAAAICAVYNPYVLATCITLEEQAVTPEVMRQRIVDTTVRMPWLVLEEEAKLAAFAYANPWRARSAYRYAVETTVYVAETCQKKGYGSQIYRELIEMLRRQGVHAVIGGILLPNAGSVALHERLGFKKVAHFEQVGWKMERWNDVGYWQLLL